MSFWAFLLKQIWVGAISCWKILLFVNWFHKLFLQYACSTISDCRQCRNATVNLLAVNAVVPVAALFCCCAVVEPLMSMTMSGHSAHLVTWKRFKAECIFCFSSMCLCLCVCSFVFTGIVNVAWGVWLKNHVIPLNCVLLYSMRQVGRRQLVWV